MENTIIKDFDLHVNDTEYHIVAFQNENDYGDVGIGFRTSIDGQEHEFDTWVSPGLLESLTLPQGQSAVYELIQKLEESIAAEIAKVKE